MVCMTSFLSGLVTADVLLHVHNRVLLVLHSNSMYSVPSQASNPCPGGFLYANYVNNTHMANYHKHMAN